MQYVDPSSYLGTFVVKTSEIINNGDLVGKDSSDLLVVASKTAGSVIAAIGMAVNVLDQGAGGPVTGDGTKTMAVYTRGRIGGLNSTLVPSITKVGLPVLLGPVPTATVSNYTCAISTTNTDEVQLVGQNINATTINVNVQGGGFLKAQTAATTTLIQG